MRLHHLGHCRGQAFLIMASIVQYNQFLTPYESDGTTQKGLTLSNEDYIRPLPFGANWNKLRIGVCLTMDHPPAYLIAPGLVDIGVCSGSRYGIGSGTPINYIGVGWGAAGPGGRYNVPATPVAPTLYYLADLTGGWTYSGFGNTGSQYAMSQRGTTVDQFVYSRTQGGVSMIVPVTGTFNTARRRCFLIVDFNRVSQTIFQAYFYHDTNNGYCDVPQRSMLDAMEAPFFTTPIANVAAWNYQTNAMVALSLANRISVAGTLITYTNSAGPLDNLNIAWNLDSFGMTVYNVMVAKFG